MARWVHLPEHIHECSNCHQLIISRRIDEVTKCPTCGEDMTDDRENYKDDKKEDKL